MSVLGRRYAKAAIEAVTDNLDGQAAAQSADALNSDVQRFVALYKQSAMLQEMLRNPVLKQQRVAALGSILTRLAVGPVAHKLLALLAKRDRMHWLEDVSQQIEAFADRYVGRLRAQVRAAVMPTEAQTKRIAETLERRLGKPVLVTVTAEPALLAGLVCQVGDLTFDSSLSRQLAILTERLGAHAAS